MKQRPYSAKAPIKSIPIFIDDVAQEDFADISRKHKQSTNKLNQFIPQLPAFPLKSNSSANLYSKFIVKGLKNEKVSVVENARQKNKIRTKNKQSISHASETDTGTHFVHKRMLNDEGSFLSNSKSNIHLRKDISGSNKRNIINTKSTLRIQEKDDDYINDVHGIESIDRPLRQNKSNVFIRSNSAKIFQPKLLKQNGTENVRQLQKSHTQKTLVRPKTAKVGQASNFQNSGSRYQNTQQKLLKNERVNSEKKQKDPLQFLLSSKINLKSSSRAQELLTIKEEISKNHIQKNRKNISNHQKRQSIYLTNFEQPSNSSAIFHKLSKKSLKKNTFHSSKNDKNKITHGPLDLQMFSLAQERQKTIHQLQNYQQKIKYYDQIYQNQNFIPQYSLKTINVSNAMKNQSILFSKALDIERNRTEEGLPQETAQDQQLIQPLQDYVQRCNLIQMAINQKKSNGLETHQTQQKKVLNIWELSKIISISQQIQNLKRSSSGQAQFQIIQKKRELYELIKDLSFLSSKNQDDRKQFVNELPFKIISVKQEELLISPNTPLQHIYLIISGSVVCKKNPIIQQFLPDMLQLPQQQAFSYFDGELFGEPSQICSSQVIPVTQIQARALEDSVLMKINYKDYLQKFLSGSDLQEKLNVLKLVFSAQMQNGLLKNRDLQTLAFYLQRKIFMNKELIFRANQKFEDLVLIKQGKAALISEDILMRRKQAVKDMKERDKKLTKGQRKSQSLKQIYQSKSSAFSKSKSKLQPKYSQHLFTPENQRPYLISTHRKHNLIDYEVVKQTNSRLFFYKITEHQTFKVGDGVNWQSFSGIDIKEGEGSTSKSGFHPQHSLISESNNTQIYKFSKQSFGYLPLQVKKIILNKIERIFQNTAPKAQQASKKPDKSHHQPQNAIEWDKFKQKICRQVLENKKNLLLQSNNWVKNK